jgi:C4-dicarboxylate-specific signal transduction histidine kinase
MRNSKVIVGAGFSLSIMLIAGIAIVGMHYMSSIHQDMEDIVTVRNVKIDLVYRLLIIGRDRSLSLNRMVLLRDPFEIDEETQRFSGYARDFIHVREKFEAMGLDPTERMAFEKVLAEVRIASSTQMEMVELLQRGNRADSYEYLLNKAIVAQRGVEDKFNDIIVLQRSLADKAFAEASTAYRTANVAMLGLGLAAGLLAAAIAVYVTRKTHLVEVQLREVNINLEAKVERRTHDLQASNEKLQNTINTLSSTQKELIQAGKMASLGSLVAGISHEINTPIGISVTSASSLQDEVRRLRMEFDQGSMKRSSLEQYMIHADEASDILLRNLKRAAEIVRSFKQVAVDQTSDESRSINLHAYVDEIILSLHPYLKRTSLQVVNICDENITINTLPGAIYQIISNFVMNSIIHAYDPGQVGFIKISARMLGDDIMLEYSDDGKGVPAQNIKQVFDPFFTTRREQGGSGLGLNIVYNLVTNSLQGTISIESNSGSGTGFKIRFPAILHQE